MQQLQQMASAGTMPVLMAQPGGLALSGPGAVQVTSLLAANQALAAAARNAAAGMMQQHAAGNGAAAMPALHITMASLQQSSAPAAASQQAVKLPGAPMSSAPAADGQLKQEQASAAGEAVSDGAALPLFPEQQQLDANGALLAAVPQLNQGLLPASGEIAAQG